MPNLGQCTQFLQGSRSARMSIICTTFFLVLYNISTNSPGNNMQKTTFKSSSWLSHDLKLFEYMSSRKNLQIDKAQQLTETWSQKFGHHFRTIWYFQVVSFAHCLTDHCCYEKWPKVPLTYTLPKTKCNIQKNYRISISSSGISAIL